MFGACDMRRTSAALTGITGRALRVAVEAPGITLQRDAAPDLAFLGGAELGPALHLVEGSPAAFALRIALAGGTDGDAGGVRLRVEPRLPGGVGFGRAARLVGL